MSDKHGISPDGTELFAPKGKFKVVLVDTFSHEDCEIGIYGREKALKIAEAKAGEMTKVYVYDEDGDCIGDFGTY